MQFLNQRQGGPKQIKKSNIKCSKLPFSGHCEPEGRGNLISVACGIHKLLKDCFVVDNRGRP
jgi:hypothetical protein